MIILGLNYGLIFLKSDEKFWISQKKHHPTVASFEKPNVTYQQKDQDYKSFWKKTIGSTLWPNNYNVDVFCASVGGYVFFFSRFSTLFFCFKKMDTRRVMFEKTLGIWNLIWKKNLTKKIYQKKSKYYHNSIQHCFTPIEITRNTSYTRHQNLVQK